MARDDFLKSTIERLRTRVSNRCSNPSCRVPTTAPSDDTDKINNIGIAAHICAASPLGPRYSKEMTVTERKSIKNAIWLCASCSTKIDRDTSTHTVSILEGWKEKAESLAKEELGKRLPGENDAINTVSAALTGFPKSFLATAISNVHKATSQSLESLDPRFQVNSSHSENQTSFRISAKEDVTVLMNVQSKYEKEYLDKYKRLIQHGEELEIRGEAIKFNGSKLFEELSNLSEKGKVIISAKKRNGVQKLWLVNKETSVVDNFEDIRGVISYGEESLNFEGSACNDILSFKYRKESNRNDAKITFGFAFHKWNSIDIRVLPYFSRLLSFFEKLLNGWELYTALEIDGSKILDSKGIDASHLDFVAETTSALTYISNVSKISSFLSKPVSFTHDFSYNNEEFNNLFEIIKIIDGKSIYTEKEIGPNKSFASFDLVADDGAKNIAFIENTTEPSSISIRESEQETIKCFGVSLKLPAKTASFKNTLFKVYHPQNKVKEGDIVHIDLLPAQGFEYKVVYDKP